MPTHIMLATYTDQGIRNVKESPKRADAARELAESCGVEMKDLFLTMGGYDLVVLLDAEDDVSMATFALKLGSLGNVRTTTLKAFGERDYRTIIESLP